MGLGQPELYNIWGDVYGYARRGGFNLRNQVPDAAVYDMEGAKRAARRRLARGDNEVEIRGARTGVVYFHLTMPTGASEPDVNEMVKGFEW